jgi:hypothetical protein
VGAGTGGQDGDEGVSIGLKATSVGLHRGGHLGLPTSRRHIKGSRERRVGIDPE